MEDRRKRPAAVMVKQAGYVLKQQICRLSRFSQPGKLKEKRASWVRETSPMSCNRKRLAGKSSAEQVKLGQLLRFSVSDILMRDVEEKYFLSQKQLERLLNKSVPVRREKESTPAKE